METHPMLRTLGTLLALTLVAVTANSSSPEPEPGLYRVTVGVSGQNLPPGMVEESVEQCVTAEDLAARLGEERYGELHRAGHDLPVADLIQAVRNALLVRG